MDWVKKNWILLVCGLVALAGLGVGIWSLMGFKQVQADADSIAGIAGQLDSMKSSPANESTIADARKFYEKANKGTSDAEDKAKAANNRSPLREDVFPVEKATDSGYRFRDTYKAAMQKLPEIIKGGKAPSGKDVDQIITRMEDKFRKEAKLNGAGGDLRVPKPPVVTPWAPAMAATAQPAPGIMSGAEERPSMGGQEDPGRRGGGGGEEDPSRRMSVANIRSSVQPTQPLAAIPTAEQLKPAAKRTAVYQTAKSIWVYLNEDTFEMHPLGMPGSVDRPRVEDIWAAQVFYWIEQDVAQALRRVNEQTVQALPEDQRWVAQLPVKHLVSLRISDYLSQGASDASGRSTSTMVLHRMPSVAGPVGTVSFGSVAASFTDRTRSGEYDVVHFLLNLVVDARDLPRVLSELCKQNFFTPIMVQYRDVDVLAAQEAGYLYGSGPVLNVDIVCEALFFRSIYEPMMPQVVKDILDGKGAAAADAVR